MGVPDPTRVNRSLASLLSMVCSLC
jgi:hypothetical protein